MKIMYNISKYNGHKYQEHGKKNRSVRNYFFSSQRFLQGRKSTSEKIDTERRHSVELLDRIFPSG